MFRHIILRTTSVGAVAAIFATTLVFISTIAHAQTGSSGCDRACLRQALDSYLTAVFKHDPTAAHLTDDHYATQNAAVVRDGEGFWKDVSGYGELQRRYFDPVNATAAFLGLLKRNGQDAIASVRIRVRGTKVSEAEWIVGQQGPIAEEAGGRQGADANPRGLLTHPPPDTTALPSERSSRFSMISLSNDYFQAVQAHDGSWIPSDPQCTRVENGNETTANMQASSTSEGSALGGCLDNFAIFKDVTKDAALRRFLVLDEEQGVVLGSAVFVRYSGIGRQDNLVHQYFRIRNGKIAAIWAVMHFLPLGTPVTSGWENRSGGIDR